MASVLNRVGFTQIGVARGTVAKTGVGDAEGELQLWYKEGSNEYCITVKPGEAFPSLTN